MRQQPAGWTKGLRPVLFLAVALTAGFAVLGHAAPEKAHEVPPPALDEPAVEGTTETAVLAGGCFWGVQGVYQHVAGVKSAVSGYAGGAEATAHYEIVGSGRTGHAESVRITFDPHRISYGKILQIYFSVVHNPTELNRQGPDVGTQYRSAIFPQDDEQARVAAAYIEQLDKAKVFEKPIVTAIEPGHPFYPAEDYHQDFLALHPTNGYIAYNDIPKVKDLQHYFPDLYRPVPVLVSSEASASTD